MFDFGDIKFRLYPCVLERLSFSILFNKPHVKNSYPS